MLFRFARVSRIVAAVLTFATLFLITTSPVAQSAPRRPLPRAAAQEVFAPYWTSEPGWDTELQLKNNLSSGQLTVTPVLRLASGEEISLDPVTIASHTSVSVWVNEGLLKHSPGQLNQPGSYGSVVFRFTSFHARNLYAAVIPALHGGPIGFNIAAYPTPESEPWPRAALAGSQEGIWWRPRPVENDLLILSNSSQKNLPGTLWLSNAAGTRWSQPLSLAARQTVLTSSPGSTGPILDTLGGPPLSSKPSPAPKCDSPPKGTTAYENVPQSIFVGSSTAGAGVLAQTDTLTYYLDQGNSTGITPPPPPPQ
jgi:hypothetical protein